MDRIKSILTAVDFSEDSRNAVSRTFLLASDHSARLELLHIVSDSALQAMGELLQPLGDQRTRLIERAENLLSDLSTEYDPDGRVGAQLSVRTGAVLDEITAVSKSADLLALGARGWNPLRDLILGTTAERLLRSGSGPVLIVKRPAIEPYRRVIVPVDFTPHSTLAVGAALIIAPDADINIVHAYDVPLERKLWLADVPEEQINQYRNEARLQALEKVVSLRKEFGLQQQRMYHHLENGDAASIILGREASSGADLIIVGKHRRSYAGELLLGSVTRHVLAGAKCDVLVLHG
jgi:nucleotide-binding universal stress UspA family protein